MKREKTLLNNYAFEIGIGLDQVNEAYRTQSVAQENQEGEQR